MNTTETLKQRTLRIIAADRAERQNFSQYQSTATTQSIVDNLVNHHIQEGNNNA